MDYRKLLSPEPPLKTPAPRKAPSLLWSLWVTLAVSAVGLMAFAWYVKGILK